ncbi:hypothetical protein JCM19037_4334 [Geomicrobium sp. JCM 19037]|nr:hypothetical protein JCM19037_4334 [Geomicrobium sp. JCM 19037]
MNVDAEREQAPSTSSFPLHEDAISYGPDRIRVNSVHLGTVLTPLVKELGARGKEAWKL